MARTFTDSNGVTLIIPDSSVNINVVTQPTGLASTGIIALVGEAEEGLHWSEEAKLSDNSFGPGDLARVQAKYGSGRLVDGFKGLIGASASPRIQGSFNRAILVKANLGTKASKATADGHGTFNAKLAGAKGNTIKETISTSVAEAAPTTGTFSYVPSTSAASLTARVNGKAAQSLSIAANTTPAALAAAIVGMNNLNAVGGVDKVITQGLTGTLVKLEVVSGQNVKISLPSTVTWPNSPAVGDTLRIPASSVIEGGAAENVGWYLVTAVVNTNAEASISAKKITAGAPAAVAPVAFSGTPANDLVGYSPIRVDNMSGVDRNVLAGLVGQNATVSVAGSALTFTLASANVFAALPKSGDIVYIPSGSAFQGAGSANVGWYQITAVSNFPSAAFITASRLSNGSPVAVASTAIVATTDVQVINRQIAGIGKALEINDAAGTVHINTIFKQLGVDSAAAWIGTLITSAAELKKKIDLSRPNPLVTESFVHGGNIVMDIGYKGTTAALVIQTVSGIKRLQTTVVGGVGSNLDIALKDYNSIADLVDYINQQPGYSAAAASAQEAQRSPKDVLDEVSSAAATSADNRRPARIKRDIWDMTKGLGNIAQNSTLVTYTNTAKAGLPEDEGPAFLTGGAKGGSTGLAVSQAIDALANVRCNFVVPLFSRDADLDKAENQTDSTSTYTIDAINAAVKTHCINMSTPKVKRHRIGLVSKKGTFAEARASAQTMASFRIAHLFQDVKDLNSNGEIETFQPWMGAVKAAGMQAAGFYKSIFNKAINISGIVNPADFSDESQSQSEDAILAGLIPIQRQEDGSHTFLSDQLTYGLDNNFVYNSIQAVYVADIIALSLAESLKKAFVGESVADVTPAVAVSFIKGKMAEFLNSKLIVGSSEFPAGWKSIQVSIDQGVMTVRAVVIEATSIYFIPINVDIEGLRDSASA
jgi:hypothetical protein